MARKIVDVAKLFLIVVGVAAFASLFLAAIAFEFNKITEMTCLIRCVVSFAVLFCCVQGYKAINKSQERVVNERRRRAERKARRDLETAQYEKEMREVLGVKSRA